MPYFLINGNELAVSIFYLMPIMIFAFVPIFSGMTKMKADIRCFWVIAVLFTVQVAVISLSLATIARYYYDFFPLMMIMVFMGVVELTKRERVSNKTIGLLGAISVMISFALPMNAISFYATYIDYPSPLLNIFF